MVGQMIVLCLAFYQTPVDKPSLKFFQDNFIVRVGEKRVAVPLQLPKSAPRLTVSFRKNKNYAVWDDRGLTIRIGKVAKSTKLEAIATSPKVFERDELLVVVDKIKKGDRSAEASALSGSMRIGSNVFFLARWADKKGATWLEALLSVDLENPTFHPKFVSRLPGTTLADKPIDDQLFILGSRMTSVVRSGEAWGLAAFNENLDAFEFSEVGKGLESYLPLSLTTGAYVEKTTYGSRIGGRVDLKNLIRKNLVEAKEAMRFIDTGDPLVALMNNGNQVRLLNTASGAELSLLSSVAMRRTPLGLVVWSPYSAPKRAWLYEMDRWTPIAEWSGELP